jgi:hypothetical protein
MRHLHLLLTSLCLCAACAIEPATLPDGLTRERYEYKTIRSFYTERGEIKWRTVGWNSSWGMTLGKEVYRALGTLETAQHTISFECRTRPGAHPDVRQALPDASYACFSEQEEPAQRFVLAFDQDCLSGVLWTTERAYRLGHWVHDHYGWQEGFKVYDEQGEMVGALSWSWGGEMFNGVHVSPKLSERDRDLLAIARTALRIAREGEELGPVCGTMRSLMGRTSPPPEGG